MGKEIRAWQRMLSGRRLDLLDPSPLDVELGDIAHGLARVARWNGQTVGLHIFSVAQHSLLVETIAGHLDPRLPERGRLATLLHDSPEYVIGDIISPLKAVIGDVYKGVEGRLLAAIHLHFGLPAECGAPLTRLIKRADRQAAFLEATHLAGFSREEAMKYFGRPEVLPRSIGTLLAPWSIAEAEERFVGRVSELQAASEGVERRVR
jgi:5'-deoxynucleotidase YfbR-like HD superfamily hydrolase